MILSLYFIFFSTWLFFNYKYHKFNASTFLIGVYWFSSLAALLLMYGYQTYEEKNILFIAVIFHITCLFLFLAPIIKIGNVGIEKFRIPPFKYLKYFVWFLIILSTIAIVVASLKLKTVFSYNDLARARSLHNSRELYPDAKRNIFTYLAGIGQHFSLLTLFMAFYFSIYYPKKRILFILLFISSFAIVIQNLSIVGRDGTIRWFLFFIFVYAFFKPNILPAVKKKIAIFFSVGVIPMGVLFYQISEAKFTGVGKGVFYYFIDYIGEPFIYFSYNFRQFMAGTAGGRMNFPSLFPGSQFSINNLNDIYFANYNLNTFPTFVGSFYFDLGLLKTIDIALLFFLCFLLYFRKNTFYSFSKLIVFLILYEIILLGVFYYMFSSTEVINTFILIIGLSIFIEYKTKKKTVIKAYYS